MNYGWRKGLYRPMPFVASGGGGGFTPASLTGLKAWYKGDAGITTSAGKVTGWADQSGNGNNLVGSGGPLPPVNTNTLNGHAVVTFDGTSLNDGMEYTSFNPGAVNQFWAFGVGRNTAATPSTARMLIFVGNGSTDETNNNGSCIFLYYPSATQLKSFHNANSATNNTVAQNTYAQIGSIFDGSANTITAYVGNGSGTSFTTGTPGTYGSGSLAVPGKLKLGENGPNGGNQLSGDIAEMIIGTGTLSGTDLTNIASYLFGRWGV